MLSTLSIIRSHNQKILNNDKAEERADCNCRKKEFCPLEGRCLTKSPVYRVHLDIKDKKIETNYNDLTENFFKNRFNSHQNRFRDRDKISSEEESLHPWVKMDQAIRPLPPKKHRIFAGLTLNLLFFHCTVIYVIVIV